MGGDRVMLFLVGGDYYKPIFNFNKINRAIGAWKKGEVQGLGLNIYARGIRSPLLHKRKAFFTDVFVASDDGWELRRIT
jgi:hypothetical protein